MSYTIAHNIMDDDEGNEGIKSKISIRFINDMEVSAAWDDEGKRWLFSVVDVIAVLTDSKNPRNYWKVMKYRLGKDNELVTRCNKLKLSAADGKHYLTDCLSQSDMLQLVEKTPSRIDKTDYMQAMRLSPVNPNPLKQQIASALTDRITTARCS